MAEVPAARVVDLAREVMRTAGFGVVNQIHMHGQRTKPRMTLTVDLEAWERLKAALEEEG